MRNILKHLLKSEINPKVLSATELLSSCQVLARICRMLKCIPLLCCAHRLPIRSTMKPHCSFARHSRVNMPKCICAVLALFVALFPDSTLASHSVLYYSHCIYNGIARIVLQKWRDARCVYKCTPLRSSVVCLLYCCGKCDFVEENRAR